MLTTTGRRRRRYERAAQAAATPPSTTTPQIPQWEEMPDGNAAGDDRPAGEAGADGITFR
jgi:hypothetical protein